MSGQTYKEELEKAEAGIEKYIHIMNMLNKCNVDENDEFRKMYNGFYRMRQRTKDYYDTYYRYFEKNKTRKDVTFGEVLGHIKSETGRMEASFSSKLAATINPELPIWDQYVMKNMDIKVPYNSAKNRHEKILIAYNQLISEYDRLIESTEGIEMVHAFDEAYPNCKVTDIKKIDFILWQTREEL
jgi:hypothetical protein